MTFNTRIFFSEFCCSSKIIFLNSTETVRIIIHQQNDIEIFLLRIYNRTIEFYLKKSSSNWRESNTNTTNDFVPRILPTVKYLEFVYIIAKTKRTIYQPLELCFRRNVIDAKSIIYCLHLSWISFPEKLFLPQIFNVSEWFVWLYFHEMLLRRWFLRKLLWKLNTLPICFLVSTRSWLANQFSIRRN